MSQRLSKETIQSIQSQVNILDIVGQFVQLRKQGKSLFGRCPFHDERTPSFTVTEEKQLFHCFSCGRGGNVFNFMQEFESLSFPESVVRVAELAHIPIDVDLPSTQQVVSQKEKKLYEAHEKASEFYSHVLLNTKGGQEALHYLTDRGYTIDTLKEFGFGFSLKDRTQLIQLLQDLELTEQEMEATGLFVESQTGFFDRFNQRIMIPLRNEHGQIVGFSGRILPGYSDEFASQAKYLNSPETPLFTKRNFLFNFDLAKKNIRKQNKVILFEGYMDVISAWQAGVQLGVASMGTSLTPEQIQKLRRVTDTILIAYDGDRAGLEATNRAIEMIQSTNAFSVGIIPFDNGLDPDEFIKQRGPKAFIDLVEHGQETVYQFKKRFLSKKYNLQVESQKIQYIEEMIAELSKLTNEVELSLAMKSLANEFNLDYTTVQNQVKQKQVKISQNIQEAAVPPMEPQAPVMNRPFIKNEGIQRHLMYRLMHHPEAWTYLNRINPEFSFPDVLYEQLYLLVQSFRNEEEEFDVQEFMLFLNDKDLTNRNLVSEIELGQFPPECTEQEIQDLVYVLSQKNTLKEQLAQKKDELNRAALVNDDETRKKLMVEIMEIQRQLRKR